MPLFRRKRRVSDPDELLVAAERGDADALLSVADVAREGARRERALAAARAALASPDDDVRGAGAFLAGELRDSESIPALLDAVREGGYVSRQMAANSLGWLAPPEALAPLVELATSDEDSLTRQIATRALGSYRDALDVLHEIRGGDPERGVRDAAGDALAELGES